MKRYFANLLDTGEVTYTTEEDTKYGRIKIEIDGTVDQEPVSEDHFRTKTVPKRILDKSKELKEKHGSL